jgi:hypothetical protein
MQRLAMLAMIVASAGCLRQTEFKCAQDGDCSTTGAVCEGTGYCSFTDPDCASGRRYGDFSGSYSKQCVGDQLMPDGGTDDGATGDALPVGCPASYATISGGGSHVYRALATAEWTSQRDACAADGANAYLAIPDDADEAIGIAALGGAASTWIGIDDRMTENVFQTVRGGTPTYLTWASGEPNNAGDQDCVSVLAGSGELETNKCTNSYPAVCECEP